MNLRIRGAANRTTPALLTLLLASSLGLTACGGDETPSSPKESPSPSKTAATPETTMPSAVLAPEEAGQEVKMYFGPKTTLDPEMWAGTGFGAKTYQEDPNPRTLTGEEYEAARQDLQDMGPLFNDWNIAFNETAHDAEVSARNFSVYLDANPGASLENLRAQDGLLVNRYPNLGTMEIVQDKETGFFVVALYAKDKDAFQRTYAGSLVEQPGITPQFPGGSVVEEAVSEDAG